MGGMVLHPHHADRLAGFFGADGPVRELHPWPPERVALPEMPLGRRALESRPVREDQPHVSWAQTAYGSFSCPLYLIRQATVHGPAGIVGVGDRAVAETLWHTVPERDGFRRAGGDIVLPARPAEALPGLTVSLLGPAHNYFHAVVEGIARLAIVPDDVLARTARVLLPAGGLAQAELMALHGLPPGVALRVVAPGERFLAEELALPWSVHNLFEFHPRLNAFFDRVLAGLPRGEARFPRRIYVDRRGSRMRPLVNEDAVVAALEARGFEAVRLEGLAPAEQAALFRDAEIVVAPHGAGLTNLGFAQPGCRVVELMMDAYLNWGFRRIAALRGLAYDCVLGRALGEWEPHDLRVHAQRWEVPVEEVVAAVEAAG